jgi:hypothetical protein
VTLLIGLVWRLVFNVLSSALVTSLAVRVDKFRGVREVFGSGPDVDTRRGTGC